MATKFLKKLLSAGKNDDLYFVCYHIQNIKHSAHPTIVRKHESVIKDDSCRISLFGKHLCKSKAHQHRYLFLSTYTQLMKVLHISTYPFYTLYLKILVNY